MKLLNDTGDHSGITPVASSSSKVGAVMVVSYTILPWVSTFSKDVT